MPHLGALVERYQDRPFAIVGINSGDAEDTYRRGLVDHKVTWISAYQGSSDIISQLFNVEGYPTYLLIDHEGRIVMRDHGFEDDKVEELVKAAEKASD